MELNQISLNESSKPNPPHANGCLLSAPCDCHLNRTLEVVGFEGKPPLRVVFALSSCLSCVFVWSSRKEGVRRVEVESFFASHSSSYPSQTPPTPHPHPPCSHCLTLTSQYDTDAICLSPPDITTVLPAAGAWGLRH